MVKAPHDTDGRQKMEGVLRAEGVPVHVQSTADVPMSQIPNP